MHRIARALAAIGLLACLSPAVQAQAQAVAYPSRPVTIRVAYPPGGPADVAIRSYAPTLGKELGQPMVIENVPGASSWIATSGLLRAAPDGLTLLGIVGFDLISAPAIVPAARYKPEDLRAVAVTQLSELVLISGAKFGFKSVDEVVEYARAHPGKLTVGNWGNGSITHVAAVEFAEKAGIKLLHVPYKGAAPVLSEVINGTVDLTFFPLAGPLLGQIKSNYVRPIAVAAEQRNAYLPDVPAFSESKSVKGFSYTIWSGIFAAPGTPDPIVTRLNAVLGSHMAGNAWRAEQAAVGATVLTPKSVKQTEDFYKAELQKIQAVIRTLPLDPKP